MFALHGDIAVNILDFFPMISDVKDSYRRAREKGYTREEAIQKVREDYCGELSDSDESPQVWIGLAEVTGRRKELTNTLLSEADSAFSALETAFRRQTLHYEQKGKASAIQLNSGRRQNIVRRLLTGPTG